MRNARLVISILENHCAAPPLVFIHGCQKGSIVLPCKCHPPQKLVNIGGVSEWHARDRFARLDRFIVGAVGGHGLQENEKGTRVVGRAMLGDKFGCEVVENLVARMR